MKLDRAAIIAERNYWLELAVALDAQLYGWSGYNQATFVAPTGELLQLSGEWAKLIYRNVLEREPHAV